MKVLFVLLTALLTMAILLIAGVQFIRLFINELTDMALEAWRSPDMPPSP